jgi:hypothetical protein
VQRSKQLAAMFLLGAFLVGGTLGFTVDRMVGDRLVARGEDSSLDAFSAEIGLTTAQRAAVDSILDERHRIIDSIMTPVRPSIRAARDSARHQIARRLSPDQQAKFQRYIDRTTRN